MSTEPEPEPTAAPPFIHLVAGPTPDPADVAVSDAARAVLIAKGWLPPGSVITIPEPRPLLKPWLRSSQ